MKTKCFREQEFVIGGFTDPEGQRTGIGALLLGVQDGGGTLAFAGNVGTGFTEASALSLRVRLDALERSASPFAKAPRPGGGVHFVAPRLVGVVRFTEWTSDGKLRHPSFQGLREDKAASEVVRERARGVRR